MIGADRNQYVRLHTYKGVTIDEFTPDHMFTAGWSREKNNVSKASISVPSTLTDNVIPDLDPWLNWMSIWDDTGTRLHWTGPIQEISGNRDQVTIGASDMAALFARQPNPITKKWEGADPAFIAQELIDSMIEQQGLPTQTIARPDPRADKFDFAVNFEETELDRTLDQLVDVGLIWSITMGRPILGPLSFKSLASLDGERDFIDGSPVITRTGADMANEIIVRAPGAVARARVSVPGLFLSRIVDIESMFSVSNVQRVAEQYVKKTSRSRDILQLPGNIRLNPEAPVELDMLVPTARFHVEAYGLLAQMELRSMECKCEQGDIAVTVTMESVDDDPPELESFAQNTGLFGGGQ